MSFLNHPEAVKADLFRLYGELMGNSHYANFALAGGTSLALRFGHRSSVDIDLFSVDAFDTALLQNRLKIDFPVSGIDNRTPGSICAHARNIKIDFLHHPFPLLEEIESEKDMRVLSIKDVAAMKINAVTNRGSKKDFVDLFALHENGIQLSQSLEYFMTKYGGNKLLALRSLLWFNDADEEPDPVFLNDWTWETVRKEMERIVKYLARN